jgi:hypothetical protein
MRDDATNSVPTGADDGTSDRAMADLWSPRRMIVQVVAFIIGAGLLWLCIRKAVTTGDWTRIREAPPLLIAGLMACTLVSQFANASIFWITARPVHPVGFWEMQWLNLVTSVLNYAPIRLGLIARLAYNYRINRMNVLTIGGWLAAIVATTVLVLGSVFLVTWRRPQLDWIWLLSLMALLVIGGLVMSIILGVPEIVRRARGMDQMLRDPAALWGAIGLRVIDIAAFSGRMACAAAILGLDLSAGTIVLLALAVIVLTMNPLGRFGFREWAVMIVSNWLLTAGLSAEQAEGLPAQLALVESAGEALVSIPLGALCLIWYWRQWRRRR